MRTPDEYAALQYHISLIYASDEDGSDGWVAEVLELPGCLSQGRDPNDAVASVIRAIPGWVEAARGQGFPVPEPEAEVPETAGVYAHVPAALYWSLLSAVRDEGSTVSAIVSRILSDATDGRGAFPIAEKTRP